MANNRKNDEIILAALLSTPTVRAASQACGVSESVIYSRLKEPDFRERYDKERREMLTQSAAALQTHLGDAIEAMGEIVNDKETPLGVQDGLKPVLMGLAAKKSYEEHRPVKISEIM